MIIDKLINNKSNDTRIVNILVVEDDLVSRLTITKVLEKSGFNVIQANNGREGFTRFIELKPDLVLMDVMMPEMDGYATTEAIRNYEKNRSVPILMLTSLDDLDSIDRAFEVGATDFITKPINWSLLNQRIKYAIRSTEIEDQLLTAQAQLKFSQRLSKLGYWEWDILTNQVLGSDSVYELFAVPAHSHMDMEQFTANVLPQDRPIIQKMLSDIVLGESTSLEISFRVNHPGNSINHIECLGEVFNDSQGKPVKIKGSAQDISRLHKAETLIDYQAKHDQLTALPNRTFFNETLTEYLKNQPSNQISAVVILDIDRFKKVNDNLGQVNGDSLLSNVAKRLLRITRDHDFIARLGSDEFVILVKNTNNEQELNQSIIRIFNDLTKPYSIKNQEQFITFSIGICMIDLKNADASLLIAHANVARSKAKQAGGDQFMFYQANMNAESKKELVLENDLRKALHNGEIEVYYQPQVYGDTLKPYGAEALVRWNHPTEGLISPVVFIPMAESTDLIIEIGLFVMKSAIKEAEKWHAQGFDNLHIGVNLSGRQFSNSDLMKNIQSLLEDTSLPANYLDLEITESLAMSNADHNISVLKGLKALGVALSIDDFGTGYSSLSYLHSFPVDTIKIDRSFIMNLDTKEGKAIVKTIIAMANSLSLEVVAEGLEEDSHVDFLQAKKCTVFQGYKFGKPMKSNEFEQYLKDNKA